MWKNLTEFIYYLAYSFKVALLRSELENIHYILQRLNLSEVQFDTISEKFNLCSINNITGQMDYC